MKRSVPFLKPSISSSEEIFFIFIFRRTPWLLAHAPGSSASSFQQPSILPAYPGGRCNFVDEEGPETL
jgi:hypothetical protein